jgi:hypothetical protein
MGTKSEKRKLAPGDGASKKRKAIGGSNPHYVPAEIKQPLDPSPSEMDEEMDDEEKKWRSCYPSIGKKESETKEWIEVPLTGKFAAPGATFKASKIDEGLATSCDWNQTPKGYVHNGKFGFFHRAIYGDLIDKSQKVDHIHWNKADNRRSSLRIVTDSLNAFNKKISTLNTSGVCGIRQKNGKWVASITVRQKRIHIGTYKTKEEAIRARKMAEVEHFGAELNHSEPASCEKDERRHYTDGTAGFLAITGAQGIKQKLFAIVSLEDFAKTSKVKWSLQDGYPWSAIFGKLSRYVMDYDGPLYIDHRDGNPLNNRRGNLREATVSQNNMNMALRSDNTSGVKGVDWIEKTQRWRARININGKEIQLGSYVDKESAEQVRKEAQDLLHGKWARRESGISNDEDDNAPEFDISHEEIIRRVTEIQNRIKKRLRTDNTSGVRGVKFNKKRKRWSARIHINGKDTYLGTFVDKKSAMKVRADAEEKLRKEAEEKLRREWALSTPTAIETKMSSLHSKGGKRVERRG